MAGAALALLAPAPAMAACGGTKYFHARKHVVRGRPPLAIGDSVMLGAAKNLAGAGFDVDVHGCRQMGEGLRVMAARRRAGTLPSVVVVALGSNWVISSAEIHRALHIVGRHRLLGLVTPREEGGGSGSDAAVIRRAGRHHPDRIKVLDWVRYSAGHRGWFAPDGLHLGPGGAAGLTRLLLRVIPRVHPRRGPWSGGGRVGPLGFTVRRGAMRNPVLIVNKGCVGARRIELRRSKVPALHFGRDGSFGLRIGGRRRSIGLRGRFKRRDLVSGVLRVRKGSRCDTGRVHWSARPGRPRRRSGGWSGTDASGNRLTFFLPGDRLSLGSSRHRALRGGLPLSCAAAGPFSFRRPVPILKGAFGVRRRLRDGSTLQVNGRFLAAGRAAGTWRRSFPGGCDSGVVAWTARR